MPFTVPLLYIGIKLMYPKICISVLIHKRSNQFLKIKGFQIKFKSSGIINNNIHAKYCLTLFIVMNYLKYNDKVVFLR